MRACVPTPSKMKRRQRHWPLRWKVQRCQTCQNHTPCMKFLSTTVWWKVFTCVVAWWHVVVYAGRTVQKTLEPKYLAWWKHRWPKMRWLCRWVQKVVLSSRRNLKARIEHRWWKQCKRLTRCLSTVCFRWPITYLKVKCFTHVTWWWRTAMTRILLWQRIKVPLHSRTLPMNRR